ncbi:MAG: hypothetical protein J5654_11220 [Victivallales bacterium]|nr:hypothetical protein [Victivallales bacterium]
MHKPKGKSNSAERLRQARARRLTDSRLPGRPNRDGAERPRPTPVAMHRSAPELFSFVNLFQTFHGQLLLRLLGENGVEIYNEAERLVAEVEGRPPRHA